MAQKRRYHTYYKYDPRKSISLLQRQIRDKSKIPFQSIYVTHNLYFTHNDKKLRFNKKIALRSDDNLSTVKKKKWKLRDTRAETAREPLKDRPMDWHTTV